MTELIIGAKNLRHHGVGGSGNMTKENLCGVEVAEKGGEKSHPKVVFEMAFAAIDFRE